MLLKQVIIHGIQVRREVCQDLSNIRIWFKKGIHGELSVKEQTIRSTRYRVFDQGAFLRWDGRLAQAVVNELCNVAIN